MQSLTAGSALVGGEHAGVGPVLRSEEADRVRLIQPDVVGDGEQRVAHRLFRAGLDADDRDDGHMVVFPAPQISGALR